MSLTHVLTDLQKSYNLSFSFSPNTTDKCIVNLSETFPNPDLALQELCKPCNLEVKNINNVYVIVESDVPEQEIKPKKIKYFYKIHISETKSNEELGLSKIKINSRYYLADINGNFSFSTLSKTLQVEVSHLGYISKDTILENNQNSHCIELVPFSKNLKLVEVSSPQTIEHVSIGKRPGKISVNSESSGFLAGESNNAIFNTLRLQPGILSAGEQSSDYVIWNSYKGQNHLIFDGITLFKANTYNQTISGVNPNIIKTIDIYKGGYNADIGDRIGGILDIKSKTGNFNKFQSIFNLNNQLINAYVNVPLFSKASLQASFRHTFDNPIELKMKTDYIQPETDFTDVNLKFSTHINSKNPLKISFIHNIDSYIESLIDKMNLQLASSRTTSKQTGVSIYYGVNWKSGNLTDISISQSELKTTYNNSIGLVASGNTFNGINEKSIRISHLFRSSKSHQIKLGVNLIKNQSFFQSDSSSLSIKDIFEELGRLNVFITDNWHIKPKLVMNYGLKVEVPINIKTLSFQPRMAFRYIPTKEINIYASWGIYNQFISETAVLDINNNNLFHWSILNETYKPNHAQHYVLGTSYLEHKWQLSVEGFYKSSINLLSFYLDDNDNVGISTGNSRAYGLDLFLNKTFKKHKFWCGYTLSQTEEVFSYFDNKSWQPAPQNQLHELKAAIAFNFNPLFFSINYVHGSGLTFYKSNSEKIIFPYNRLDIALKYQHNFKKFRIETGVSILNTLNQTNLRFNSFSNFTDYENNFVFATPFTPFVFVKLEF